MSLLPTIMMQAYAYYQTQMLIEYCCTIDIVPPELVEPLTETVQGFKVIYHVTYVCEINLWWLRILLIS